MITVIVIAKNEEERIVTCLESVKWADQIIVADNGSTDDTVKVSRKYTDDIVTFTDQDFAGLRNKAMEKAKGDWVLYVDADERVLAPLKEEIEQLMVSGDKSAYALSRRNIIFGSEEKYGPFWPDWVIRLLKREDFDRWTGRVHESVHFKGDLGYTKNSLLHLTHRGVDHIVLKSLDWSHVDAKLRLDAHHPPMTRWRFLRILFSELYNQGIKRGGFFAGTIGTMDAILQTFSMFITYVRLWQLQQPEDMDKKYKELDQKLEKENFEYR